ncbi:MAG: MaoC family dehydratase N-terminal domain-containing protein [Proteobacteria bacterium]|nr:MaoC family dehydratase N-terminal domain-containing protein [Pseudomonadota bacterium]
MVKYFEDIEVGEKSRTRARTITETDIVMFAGFSGDWYPLHVDVEYAERSPFGGRIAHGFLVLSVASGLLPLYETAIVAFYGMDRVRFFGPTRIGDTLHLEIEVTGKQDKGEIGGVVANDIRVVNQNGEAVAGFVMKGMIAKRN